jgi:hypothetical protein
LPKIVRRGCQLLGGSIAMIALVGVIALIAVVAFVVVIEWLAYKDHGKL